MSFCANAAAPNVVIDIGTFCALSARFSAVTVISSSSPGATEADGAVSAIAHGALNAAAIPPQNKYLCIIPMADQRSRHRLC
jgi:hypothetical protein